MAKNDSPTLICQHIVNQPVETVFQTMLDPKFTSSLWFAESRDSLKEGQITEWKLKASGSSLKVLTEKIISNKLTSTIWQDTFTKVEYTFHAIDDQNSFITLSASSFKETGQNLLNAIEDKRSIFKIVLNNLSLHFSEDDDEWNLFFSK